MAIGEAGKVDVAGDPGDTSPTFTISLKEPLTDPVFAFTSTANGEDFIIRVVDQTLDANGDTVSFTIALDEWDYMDGSHQAMETVNWLAIEEGIHTLPDGRVIEARTENFGTSNQNDGVDLNFNANFDTAPVVLTSVMSQNENDAVDSDPSQISSEGFRLTMQEQQGRGAHAPETVGWIAIQKGSESGENTAFSTANSITHTARNIILGTTVNDAVILAETQTLNGKDTAIVSISSQSDKHVKLHINEEQAGDSEQAHTTESVGIVAFQDGLIPCFTKGCRISIPEGQKKIEDLSVGDLVITEDSGLRPIRWIGKFTVTHSKLTNTPKLRPIRIRKGAMGNGLPERDLVVSRQHRMLIRSKISERMFSKKEVLVPAIKLTALKGIVVDRKITSVTYYHLLFDKHELIFAENTPTESFFAAPHTVHKLNEESREEILSLFPELANHKLDYESARLIPNHKDQKALIRRHIKNQKPCIYSH